MAELEPDCDVVFRRYCAPFYSQEELANRLFPDTRPDLEEASEPTLGPEAAEAVAAELRSVGERVREEWPGLYGVALPVDVTWVEAFDRYYDHEFAAEALELSKQDATRSNCLTLCSEFAWVLAEVLTRRCPALTLRYERPHWESALVHPSGYRVNVFHWAVKKFSGYGCDDGCSAKLEACLGHLGA